MSIIHDALKKANQDKTVYPTSQKSGNATNLRAANERKKSMNWGPLVVVLVAGVIIGPIAAPLFSNPFRQATYDTGAAFSDSQNRKAQFGMEEMALRPLPNPMVAASPVFNLSGLVFSQKGDSYCLINGQILKPGDSIRGAKLMEITQDKAILEYRGEKIVLSN
jgi:hypothetical protein